MIKRSLTVGLLLIALVVLSAVATVPDDQTTPPKSDSSATTTADVTNEARTTPPDASDTTATPPPVRPRPRQTPPPVVATETTATTATTTAPAVTKTTAAPQHVADPVKPVVKPIPLVVSVPPPRWLLPLLILNSLLALAALTLLVIPLVRKKPQPNFDDTELGRRLMKQTEKLAEVQAFLSEKIQKRGDELRESMANSVTREQLDTQLTAMRARVALLDHTVEEIATAPTPPPPSPSADPVAIEHQVLGECWKQFRDNKELSAAFDAALQDHSWDGPLAELAKLVPDDLKPSFDNVVAPCREYRTLVRKISLIPQIVSGELKRLGSDAEEVRRTREYATLLASIQSGDNGSRLSFRFRSWITEHFLPFADLYLQRYQQAQLENRHREMQSGLSLIRQLLQFAAVEPIDVTLGETAFDSTLHIGRSTTNDPRFSDGVITGVVRNGFVEGGQQVIRHPEVIVNRMR
jgi:hypothetical protein